MSHSRVDPQRVTSCECTLLTVNGNNNGLPARRAQSHVRNFGSMISGSRRVRTVPFPNPRPPNFAAKSAPQYSHGQVIGKQCAHTCIKTEKNIYLSGTSAAERPIPASSLHQTARAPLPARHQRSSGAPRQQLRPQATRIHSRQPALEQINSVQRCPNRFRHAPVPLSRRA